jgi:hypothetical protein
MKEDSTGLHTAGGDAHFHKVDDKGNACVRWNGAGFRIRIIVRVGGPPCTAAASKKLSKQELKSSRDDSCPIMDCL